MKVVIDTNVILDSPEVLLREDIEVVLPYTVVSELDKLKRDPDLRASVQKAFRIIKELNSKGKVTFVDIPKEATTNDEKIIKVAKESNSTLWTNDIGASIIASSLGVATQDFISEEIDQTYVGYREIFPLDESINNLVGINELMKDEAEHYFGTSLQINEYVYYKLPSSSEKYAIWRLLNTGKVVLVKQTMKPYHAAGVMIEPQDIVQMCALDAIFSTDTALTIIEGKVGTGKSLLALCAALARTKGQHNLQTYQKILVTRAPLPIDKSLRLGYLPGNSDEKMSPWLSGVKSNLKFLYERTKKDAENGEASKVFEEFFEAINLESIQGLNIHGSILIVDEYQLLSADMLKQILSRAASGAKIILVGDPQGQVYGANRGVEGFKKLQPWLKNCDDLVYIRLQNIYRSKLTEFVEKIFS